MTVLESDIGKILPVMYCSMVPNTCTIFQVLSQSQCRSNTEKHHPPFEAGLVGGIILDETFHNHSINWLAGGSWQTNYYAVFENSIES